MGAGARYRQALRALERLEQAHLTHSQKMARLQRTGHSTGARMDHAVAEQTAVLDACVAALANALGLLRLEHVDPSSVALRLVRALVRCKDHTPAARLLESLVLGPDASAGCLEIESYGPTPVLRVLTDCTWSPDRRARARSRLSSLYARHGWTLRVEMFTSMVPVPAAA